MDRRHGMRRDEAIREKRRARWENDTDVTKQEEKKGKDEKGGGEIQFLRNLQ